MTTQINVSEKTHRNVKASCERCQGELLVFVHLKNQSKTCVLGCGHCGHPNEIKLGE